MSRFTSTTRSIATSVTVAAILGGFAITAPAMAADAYGDNHSESNAYPLNTEGCLSDNAGKAELSGHIDFFQIDISAGQQRLQLSLNGDKANDAITAELFKSAVIMGSDNDLDSPTPGYSIDQETAAGSHIVAVSGSGVYDLCFNTVASNTPRDDAFEPNNDIENATELQSPAVFQSAVDGEFGRQLNDDWYQLTINESAGELAVILRVSAYEANPDLQLFDASGNELAHSADSAQATQQVTVRATVEAGEYFAKVSGDNAATTYDLCFDTVATGESLRCGNDVFRTPNSLALDTSPGSSGGGALTWLLGLLLFANLRFTQKRNSLYIKADFI